MECFRCDQPAVQECARCGALYCDDHGDTLCERCMDPFNALPSSRVYRGSLLALLIGTVFAVWLLVRPGSSDAGSPPAGLIGVLPSNTVAAGAPTPTATPPVTTGNPPRATATPQPPAQTQAPTPPPATATAAPTSTTRSYTVVAGDTLTVIGNREQPANVTAADYVARIYQANPTLGPNSILLIGQVITLP